MPHASPSFWPRLLTTWRPCFESTVSGALARTPNDPSFVSPNVTSPSVAEIVTRKSINRPDSSSPKMSVRSSSQTFVPSLIQSLRVTILPVSPLFERDKLAVLDLGILMRLLVVGPEIVPVDVAVREPQRMVMRMIVHLAFRAAARPGTNASSPCPSDR